MRSEPLSAVALTVAGLSACCSAGISTWWLRRLPTKCHAPSGPSWSKDKPLTRVNGKRPIDHVDPERPVLINTDTGLPQSTGCSCSSPGTTSVEVAARQLTVGQPAPLSGIG